MGKFFKLCSCEGTKIMKKTSTKVMLIILILSLFLSAGIAHLTKQMYDVAEDQNIKNYKSSTEHNLEVYKQELSTNGESLDTASKNKIQSEMDVLQIALDNDVNVFATYWKSDLLSSLLVSKSLVLNYNAMGEENLAKEEQSKIDKQVELLKNDSFSEYIKYQKDIQKQSLDSNKITKAEYDDALYTLNLADKYEIGKSYDASMQWKNNILQELSSMKESLRAGINYQTMNALTEEDAKDFNNRIKMDEYRLEHNIEPYISDTSTIGKTRKVYDYIMSSITMMVLAVMIIIIAGSSISSEISKGTIKFWSFTPNKRWKILLSKLFVNTCILVFTTIAISLVSCVVGNIFFGGENATPYLFVRGGNVKELHYILFTVLYNLAGAIDIFVFLLLAMMLSTVTRSTAASVGISIAAYLGGATIMQILNLFIKTDWLKFIPFNNLSVVDKIFTNDIAGNASAMVSEALGNTSVTFSLSVLGVCAIIMITTMFDSFRKRDIK